MYALPREVTTVLDRLTDAKQEAFLVGGCVRDMLRGVSPHDFDITTDARPERIKEIFPELPVIETGMQHGTVSILLEGTLLEITTYRVDGPYLDHRRPQAVSFTPNLREDLARRDFTINAIAYHPKTGMVDPYGGQEDLAKGLLRCVGNPQKRFQEDALRILRAARFTACLDMQLDEETTKAMALCLPLLSYVAKERITIELEKWFCGPAAQRVAGEQAELLARCILGNFTDPVNISMPPASALPFQRLPAEFPVRLALYLRQADLSNVNTGNLPLSLCKNTRQELHSLLTELSRPLPASRPEWCKRLSKMGFPTMKSACLLRQVLEETTGGSGEEPRAAQQILQELESDASLCLTRADLAITGKDLLSLGIPANQAWRELFDTLLEEIWQGHLPNSSPALLQRAQELLLLS